jgi:putative DNA primase/helicase
MRVRRHATETVRLILLEATTIADKDARAEHSNWSFASESRARLDAMIHLARPAESIQVAVADLDRDPYLLNCLNGTIDLRTGRLRGHRREDLITALCPVEYDPHATCPLWDATLDKVFAGDDQLITYWDRLAGLALTGVTDDHVLPILWGGGSNGKSTLVKTLINLLGPDFALAAPPGLLLRRHGEPHPTERAALFGKRLVVEMETDAGVALNEGLIKMLTGSDAITARRMREDFWSFSPTHKLMLCTNHKPRVVGTDHAIWRRLRLIPFIITIPDDEAIPDMPLRLVAEYPGILARCVRGSLDWQEHGLGDCDAVQSATRDYRTSEDILRAFLQEQCLEGPSLRIKAGDLYGRFRGWCLDAGESPKSQREFGEAMTELKFERITNNGTWYLGLQLCDPVVSLNTAGGLPDHFEE